MAFFIYWQIIITNATAYIICSLKIYKDSTASNNMKYY